MKNLQLVLFFIILVIIFVTEVNSFILLRIASSRNQAATSNNNIVRPTSSNAVSYDFRNLPRNVIRRKIELGNNLINAFAQFKIGLALEGARILVSATSPEPTTNSNSDPTTPRPNFTFSKTITN
ncbi:uncharacterized protein LOC129618562 [Condylostylus longicornis]|uniref:uncharacterized protein LOC129618562 n=1 Tax=Condylostylus longicornis TaxID=2530218 RepID=UPI00244E423F|nr:uncharacterized protein LOC129618562 [Condylostylus longicornis]